MAFRLVPVYRGRAGAESAGKVLREPDLRCHLAGSEPGRARGWCMDGCGYGYNTPRTSQRLRAHTPRTLPRCEHPKFPAGLSGGPQPAAEPSPRPARGGSRGSGWSWEHDKSSPGGQQAGAEQSWRAEAGAACPSLPLAFPEANEQSAGTGAANCKGKL